MQAFDSTQDENSSLYERVLADISSGELQGGQRLKVVELAKRYGVSTSPVREVLRRMQGEGFVEINQNRGAIVRKTDASTLQNIFELLELLEPYFVIWFADYARPEMVAEMEEIQEKIINTPLTELATFRKLDAEFHWAICKRHYNQRAAETWRNLRRALIVYGSKLPITPSRYEIIMKEHKELLAAFRDNDVERAALTIRKHLDGSLTQMSQQARMQD